MRPLGRYSGIPVSEIFAGKNKVWPARRPAREYLLGGFLNLPKVMSVSGLIVPQRHEGAGGRAGDA